MPGAACHAFVFASEQNGQPAVAIVWPLRCVISWRYRTEQAGRPMTLEEEIFNDESERAQRMGRGVQESADSALPAESTSTNPYAPISV